MASSDEQLLLSLINQASQTSSAARKIPAVRESFKQLGEYLDAIASLLKSFSDNTSSINATSLNSLQDELHRVSHFISSSASRSRLTLVVMSKAVGQQAGDLVHSLGSIVGSLEGVDGAAQLGLEMQQAELGPDPTEGAMVHRLERAMKDSPNGGNPSSSLLQFLLQVAEVSGKDDATLLPEARELRRAKTDSTVESGEEAGDLVKLLDFVECMVTAELKDARSTLKDEEYERRRQSSAGGGVGAMSAFGGGGQSSPRGVTPSPQGYLCFLTKEVMSDPVMLVETGETYDRVAIEKWFADGNRTCPATQKTLKSLKLTPNTALRDAIDDWRKRNTVQQIHAAKAKLNSSKEEEVEAGLLELFKLCEERPIHRFWINAEGLIGPVVALLKSSSRNLRRKTLATLTNIATNSDENKESMAESGVIPLAVRSLARDVGESRQGVALLLELSKSPSVCEEIGRAQGSILLLVTMLGSDNANAAKDAKAVLEQLSNNDQNVVQMAEANHFRPLAQRLSNGSDLTRIVMASALSRMALTNQSKAALAQEGAIEPLVKMIATGKLEAKAAGLGALKNLSSLPENRELLVGCGVVPPLLQLLFSVTSVVMSLKEGAAATLANLTVGSESQGSPGDGGVLGSEETVYQLLSLLNLAGPAIQGHLMRALLGLASPAEAVEVRNRMRGGGAVTVLMPFLEGGLEQQSPGMRINATKLLQVLCRDGGGKEVADNLMDGGGAWLKVLVKLLDAKEKHEDRAAAAGLLAALPTSETVLTNLLLQEQCLPLLMSMLNIRSATGTTREALLEGATGALVRFTLSSNVKLQQQVAELGVMSDLVNVLVTGNSSSKGYAAQCLDNMAQSSFTLSVPAKSSGGGCCFTPPPPNNCGVHGGDCDEKKTFCLLEADAVGPLVSVLSDAVPETAEAALSALSTLLSDQGRWENGIKSIHQANGFASVVQILSTGTERAKTKAVWMLEKLFRIDEYKFEYGAKAQGALVELTQHGSAECKPVAAKILSHLEILQNQSSYF